MLKNFVHKFFGGSNELPNNQNYNYNYINKDPIYAIPTVSTSTECFRTSKHLSPTSGSISNNRNQSKSSQNAQCADSYSSSTKFNSSKLNNILFPFLSSNPKLNNCQQEDTSSFKSSKYDETKTKQIFIAPHCIKYTNSTLDETIYRIDDESLNEIAHEILESSNAPPKLQIVEFEKKYFAINNSHLQIYKQLQYSGLITHVQADLINIEAIPEQLRNHLLQTPIDNLILSKKLSENEEMENNIEDDVLNQACSSSSGFSSSRTTAGMSSSGLADVLDPSILDNLNKNVLVDETYEFGECENCISDGEDLEHVDEENLKKSIKRLQIIEIAEEKLGFLEKQIFKKKYDQANNKEILEEDDDEEDEELGEDEEDEEELDTYDDEEELNNSGSIDNELLFTDDNHFIKSVCNDYGKSFWNLFE
jgi:hypothetical protein